jgi:hypothetical protein
MRSDFHAAVRCSQKSSHRLLIMLQQRPIILFAPLTIHCIPECSNLCPITVRHPALSTSEPTKRPRFLKSPYRIRSLFFIKYPISRTHIALSHPSKDEHCLMAITMSSTLPSSSSRRRSSTTEIVWRYSVRNMLWPYYSNVPTHDTNQQSVSLRKIAHPPTPSRRSAPPRLWQSGKPGKRRSC